MRHEPEQWKRQYQRDGYLVVGDVLDADHLAELRGAIDRICEDPESVPPRLRQFLHFEKDFVRHNPKYNELGAEGVGNALRNIMELPLFAPVFARLIGHEGLLDILEALFETTEFAFHNYKCIIKAPRVGSTFCWHRDLPYLEHTSPNLITAMLCLDEMSEANGATVVYPGTHRVPHEQVTRAEMEIAEADLPDSPPVRVECPAGSAVLFHVNIIHGGGPNRSDLPRRNVIGIWSGPEAYPVEAVRYAYQGLMPRSRDPERRRQLRMSLPSREEAAA